MGEEVTDNQEWPEQPLVSSAVKRQRSAYRQAKALSVRRLQEQPV